MLMRLKELRTQHGISQQKLADVLSISQPSINKYENHNIEPEIALLIKIADFFDTTIDYLVGRTDQRERVVRVSQDDLDGVECRLIDDYRKLNYHLLKAGGLAHECASD